MPAIASEDTQPQATTPALAADRFVNRVWVVVSGSDVAPGALYVFLSDGVLVISSRTGTPAFGRWQRTADGLTIEEEGRPYRTTIVELTSDTFRLRLENPGTPTEIVLAPAAQRAEGPGDPGPGSIGPRPTSYRCGAEVLQFAFEASQAYVTLPDGTTITLAPSTVPDAPASRRTFSDGRLTVIEDTSESHTRVLFARARMRPRPCTTLP